MISVDQKEDSHLRINEQIYQAYKIEIEGLSLGLNVEPSPHNEGLVYQFSRSIRNLKCHSFYLYINLAPNFESLFCQISTQLNLKKHNQTSRALIKDINQINMKKTNSLLVYVEDTKILKNQMRWEKPLLIELLRKPSQTCISKQVMGEIYDFEEFLTKIMFEIKVPKKRPKQILKNLAEFRTAIIDQIKSRPQNSRVQNYQRVKGMTIPNPGIEMEIENGGKSNQLSQFLSDYNFMKNKRSKKVRNKIVRKISIITQKKDQLWNPPKSSFGIVYKLNAMYRIDKLSINYAMNRLMRSNSQISSENQISEVQSGSVMEKVPQATENKASADESFRTEVSILKYFRNFESQIIGSYYLKQLYHNYEVQSFFIDEYPKTFHDIDVNFQKMFKIMELLSQGLKDLHEMGVLHRDLKPDNIMLDQNYVPKIIDFGSAWIRGLNIPQISDKLRTNTAYNLIQCPEGMPQQQFEHHPYFDVYAFGKLIVSKLWEALDKDKNRYNFEGLLRQNLRWIQQRCSAQYSWERIDPVHLHQFMKRLHTFLKVCKTN